MSQISFLKRAEEFLRLEKIAVVGVSDRREDAANANYRALKAHGKRVFAINPRITAFEGDRCYPDLAHLPEKPEGVLIITSAARSLGIVQECVTLGVRHVWMHCALGTTPRFGRRAAEKVGSVSAAAVELCRENQIEVIPGGCPLMVLGDRGHRIMRRVLALTGALGER